MSDTNTPSPDAPQHHVDHREHWMSQWLVHYTGAASARHILTGLAILIFPFLFVQSAFVAIVEYTHLWVWGVAYILCGGWVVVGLAAKRLEIVRSGMLISTTVNIITWFSITWSVVYSWIADQVPYASPFVPLLLGAVCYKDLAVIRSPLRDPLGDYLEEGALEELA